METLHRLAGVQDASALLHNSAAEGPSHPHVIPEPPPIPESDIDPLGRRHSQRGSRASLPLNRQPSHKSFRSSKDRRSGSQSRDKRQSSAVDLSEYPQTPVLDQHQIDEALSQHPPQHHHRDRRSHETAQTGHTATTTTEASDDFTWGPTHPCFPHPNPHCAPSSPSHHNTRVIRVRRDYLASGDLYPQFANLYPEILDPLVSDADFRLLISTLNAKLARAFDPYSTRAWLDSVLGLVTGWLWDDFGFTGAKGEMEGLEEFVDGWNRGMEGEGREVRVVQPRRTGFMALDFVIPDPGIDVAVEEGEDEEDRDGQSRGGSGIGPAE
ncbi:hypothetical protein B0A50_02094 [Salinomyces thailandicus]|uniref:Ras modification protein ERF4 n=1 Tax=Salinomyces thailandicus TaxID=706561 RepID=A0A4U0UA23_9PEZI|nr:hypothetical protein B0A50_02094 [Salinomyces thailandica]